MRQVIESIILEEDQFDVRDALPNVVPDPSSLQLESEYSCPVGKVSPGSFSSECITVAKTVVFCIFLYIICMFVLFI